MRFTFCVLASLVGCFIAGATPQLSDPLTLTTVTTSPATPITGESFAFTLNGTGFDPNTVVVVFAGSNCSPCIVPNLILTKKTSKQIEGTATVDTAGTFTVSAQNAGAAAS